MRNIKDVKENNVIEIEDTKEAEKVENKEPSEIVKKNKDGKWQIKLATGERAIKLFDKQRDAIEYAKNLMETQGGSIRIHSLKGKIRK